MAKITNIKTRDGAVHPIALPFAICDTVADESIKELTFSGGDAPTELVNGQQIMVQFSEGSQTESTFSVKITDGASITYTVPVVLNSSDTSVAPYIGEGAVVNLTYNGSKFYISNAAALTGFEIPTDVTLATITNKGGTVGLIYNNSGTIDLIYMGRRSVVYDIQNSGIVSNIKNLNGEMDSGGSITMFDNASRGQVEQINNDGTILSTTNTGTIEKIDNTTGIIGVPDSLAEGIFNGSSATIHYIENSGKIVTFKNNGTTGDSGNTITGIQNTGNLYNITNSSNGTIYQLNNAANIKTITIGTAGTYAGPGLIDQITNWSGDAPYNVSDYTPTKGIDYFTNKGRIKTLETTGDIGFAGTLSACPAGYTSTNYYDTNTGIKNTGIIHNIQNDYEGRRTHRAVIRHIANYGGNGVGGISLFENGGDLSYLVNVPAATGASDIPGGNIGEIINRSTISKISNYGSVVIDNYNNLTINPKSGSHALNIEGSLPNSLSLDYGDIKYTTTPVVSGVWDSDPWATLDGATAETIPVYSHSTQAGITLMLHNISAGSSDFGVNLLYSTTSATAPIRFNTIYLRESAGTTSRAATLPLSLKWPGNDGEAGDSLLIIQNPNINYESTSENRTASLMAGTIAFYTINFGPSQNRKQAVALRLYRPEDTDSRMWISQLNL